MRYRDELADSNLGAAEALRPLLHRIGLPSRHRLKPLPSRTRYRNGFFWVPARFARTRRRAEGERESEQAHGFGSVRETNTQELVRVPCPDVDVFIMQLAGHRRGALHAPLRVAAKHKPRVTPRFPSQRGPSQSVNRMFAAGRA